MKAGFTRHEAMLYITLCQEGDLTGYEAAKISGIPRSNAYLALAGLVDKGGAFRIDGDTSKYSAVPADELVFNLRKEIEQVYRHILENAPDREVSNDPYYTVTGRDNIIKKMCYLISQAKERVYISTSPAELEVVLNDLIGARDRGLKVVIITSQGFELPGVTIYRNEKQPGQIRIIADTAHVLTGELKAAGESTCLYSRNRNLIQLFKEAMGNEIKLITLNKQPD